MMNHIMNKDFKLQMNEYVEIWSLEIIMQLSQQIFWCLNSQLPQQIFIIIIPHFVVAVYFI
jgi:hypothetical protein